MNTTRRTVLKGAASSGVLATLIAAGALRPTQVLAAEWNKAAFEAKDMAGALKGAGINAAADSKDIVLKAPDIAENGSVVPVEALSNIPGTTALSIFVEQNPSPMSARFVFANGALPEVAVRLKLGKTSNVKVVAEAGGKFYSAHKEIKVTVGGCGG